MPDTKKKILIIRLSSLGDILLTTPVVRAIAQKYHSAKIDFLLRPQYAKVYKDNPYINRLIIFTPQESGSLATQIKNENYDLIIDLQNNLRSRKLTGKSGSFVYRFQKSGIKKLLLVKFKINLLNDAPQIPYRYASTLPGLELDDKGAELFIPAGIKSTLAPSKKYIGFCPGSRHNTKMWPTDYFAELGNRLAEEGYQIILLGGRDDKKICEELSLKIDNSINLCRDDDLFQIAADMKACRLVVCNDSGLMHTATAVKVPVAVIFGSTVKEFGFFPYKTINLVLENNTLSCRPCSHTGKEKCPKGHFKCMLEITPGILFNKLMQFIGTL